MERGITNQKTGRGERSALTGPGESIVLSVRTLMGSVQSVKKGLTSTRTGGVSLDVASRLGTSKRSSKNQEGLTTLVSSVRNKKGMKIARSASI